MEIINLIKSELSSFNKFERFFFPAEIIFIIFLSFIINDNKIALISSICGISYTILAGKGKISCYFIGIIGTFCYCYIAFQNNFYGNLLLYGLYFFPMQIIGIFNWRKHLNIKTKEIYKTKLNTKERYIYFLSSSLITILTSIFLIKIGDSAPFIDAFVTIFSILGQYLTVKRCIEQWYVWFIVDLLTLIMWIISYINGSNCLATIIMWLTYTFLAIYFYLIWKKEIK